MRFRTRPPGVVEGPIGAGTLNLPIPCARAKQLATRPFKFTLTGPHMLAKTLHDRHYREPGEARARDRRRARRAGEAPRRRRGAGGRGQPARPPGRVEVGRGSDQQGAAGGAEEGEGGGAPVLRQLRRAVHPEGHLGEADGLPQRPRGRPRRDGVRPPPAGGARGVQGPAQGHRLRPRRGGHQAHRGRDAPTRSRAPSSAPKRRWAAGAYVTSTPTAASGCSSATWRTARSARW